jgi:hypothetical protein
MGRRRFPTLLRQPALRPRKHSGMWLPLKKYGEIKEAEKDGGYFRYELTAVKTADLSD